jgi:hypothetical protein
MQFFFLSAVACAAGQLLADGIEALIVAIRKR